MADEPVVTFEQLTVSYTRAGRKALAVKGLSFEIGPGQAYGLVGESGCGKTTAAMALMRYLPASAVVEAGHVRFCGDDVMSADQDTLRRWRGGRVAMVYQDPASALNPSMRVGDQVAEVYRHHKDLSRTDATEAAVQMLERVHLTDAGLVAQRYPHQLSGGQQQRVVIGMALAANPRLLVLDEPTTGLDATVESGVLDLVEELRDMSDASILFISHNLAIVARLCDRVGVLYAGRLVEEGDARQVFTSPGHPYTSALLGSVPRLTSRKGAHRLEGIPGMVSATAEGSDHCRYADRCSMVQPGCWKAEPHLVEVRPGQQSRCFYSVDVSAPGLSARRPPETQAGDARDVLLSVASLVKTYRNRGRSTTAADDVTFAVKEGEIFALVGESGSGKSTVARCITGIVDPTEGRILLRGKELTRKAYKADKELRRSVQMVFQDPESQLNPRHTVMRILRRCIKVLNPSSREDSEAALRRLAAAVQLGEAQLEARPGRLSGGQRQRVAIACALAGTPSLLVCDEPASALDVSVQAGILNMLADLQREQGVAILIISHDLAAVHYLADRIGVMYLGQLVETTSADDVFSAPTHPYTETLLASMPTVEGGAATTVKPTGSIPSMAEPPTGCRFHTRCPRYIGSICKDVEPPWQQSDKGAYRCHIPPAELREAQTRMARASTPRPGPEPISAQARSEGRSC